ncbi:uncharacterized protein MONBRDRAFT_30494 [Monosiga brevicollis MX1]|uniref:Uncharacterized protein n=1 Tax=Monosiga brevicollis TaxID=81824 RepID=A9VE43_MONBE|nr:uncharacterized protein MONBRDRAFT_30494 [Monosiga brevicollis MX1]EDQ84193.1 predicted protein [Monosiga brevicollis MX1]|eukprot:XP_001750981.1 hypothetical protein [Monosiga brevicollis MX1]
MGGWGRRRQQGAVAVLLLWIAVRGAVEGAESSMILSSVGNADSRFNNQSFVRAAGYTHMAASNLQLCLSYRWLSPAIFPNGSDAEAWRAKCVKTAQKEIDAAHAQGLKTNHAMDVFTFPSTLIATFPNMTDGHGTIVLSPMTQRVLAGMVDEMVALFPTADSYMIRVGENYLPSEPYFTGNEAVNFSAPFDVQQADYVLLIRILKAAFVEKRFAPSSPKRFHSSLAYYLNVTNQITPHPKLIFSIKHVMLDFWPYVAFNPTLAQGAHQQIVEVECAREYEGKGAFPNYIGHGVINRWAEVLDGQGLKDVVNSSLITGLWLWSSGGGWGGVPKVGVHELWPLMNTLVILRWWRNNTSPIPGLSADEAFLATCTEDLGMAAKGCPSLLTAAVASQEAVLQMRYCQPYDASLLNQYMPTNNWFRDDRMGGYDQLNGLTYEHELLEQAVAEKQAATATWARIQSLIGAGTANVTTGWAPFFRDSAKYGALLSHIIAAGNQTGHFNVTGLTAAVREYDAARSAYQEFLDEMGSAVASPMYPYYEDVDGHNNNVTHAPGLNASVDLFRRIED